MRIRCLILALICVLASLLVPVIAAANAAAGAENRVWAFDLGNQVSVGLERLPTLEAHRGCEIVEYDVVFGSLLAAKGGRSVLGHRGYVEKARELGARRFHVPTHIFEKMTDAERWAANKKFLDRLIARGDEVILSTPAHQARAESYFARELEYLLSQGYRLLDGGTRMVPGR